MSIFSELKIVNDLASVGFNTGTLFDLVTGRYVRGINDEWYLNGGLSNHINMFVGMSGQFKSTISNSLCVRSLALYDKSECIIKDSEQALSKDKDRAIRMAEEFYNDKLSDRVLWLDSTHYNLNNTDVLIKEYCNKKMERKSELTVETPFIDEFDKPIKIWVPTFIVIDSLTMLKVDAEEEMLDGSGAKGLGDAKINTLAMLDGNKKTTFTAAMRRRCQQYGIVFVVTGHYDTQVQMDPYQIMPKDTPFSRGNFKVKGCGSEIKFLASIYAKCQATVLQDSNKEALYSSGRTLPKDLHEVSLLLERCKTANAGEITPFVVSQSEGLLNAATNYHYLRLHDYFALNGSKQKHQCALYPELTISRNTVRELASATPELRRALELCAQLCFIKRNWNVKDLPFDFDISPSKLFDNLISDKHKTLADTILNTRGYWSYDKKHPVSYMSLFKVLDLAKAYLPA